MTNKEREIINSHLRCAYNMLRVNKDKHAAEIETVIRSIESDIWASDRWPEDFMNNSVYAGAMGDTP